jgi:hypothetical protein
VTDREVNPVGQSRIIGLQILIVSVWPPSSDFNYDSTLKMLHENVVGLSTFIWREFQGPQRKARVFFSKLLVS